MTETQQGTESRAGANEPRIITDALAIIDKGLSDMVHRELVSSDEVSDLLLDVRALLATSEEPQPVAG